MSETNFSPLHGIRVLDLTHVVSGPFASRYLALLGAEIIKVENLKTQGDMTRQTGPIENGTSVRFCSLNHNKKSISLDLSKDEGRRVFLRLIEKCDVVIDNFRPGTLEKLGVPFTKMQEVNEKIIYGNLSGFGTYGPYRDLPAYDIIAQAMSGMMMLNGEKGAPPVKVGTSIADIIAGMNLVIGVLAAIHKRDVTGKGCSLETSLTDSLISALMMEYITYFHTGVMPERIGNEYREWCPSGSFAARDGYFVLAVGREAEFTRLARDVLHNDELAFSEEYNSHSKRVKNRETVNSAISEWSANLSVEEACKALREAGIPCTQVYNVPEVTKDEHIKDHREMFLHYSQSQVGDITVTNIPVKLHGLDTPSITPAPQFGEHTEDILKNLLHLTDDEISSLKAVGAVKTNE